MRSTREDGAKVAEESGPEAVDALRNLLRAGQNYRQQVASTFRIGITESHALTSLQVLGPQSQNALAGNLGLTAAATTSVVDRLETAGLARRTQDPADRRRWVIELDERGSQVLRESRRWLQTAFDDLSPDALAEVSGLLQTIAVGIDRAAERLADPSRTN